MNQKIILTDRSSTVTLLNCRRAGWWSRYYRPHCAPQDTNGTATASPSGLQQVKRHLYQVVGTAVHHTIQQLMLHESGSAESLVQLIQTALENSWSGRNAAAEADHPSLEFAL